MPERTPKRVSEPAGNRHVINRRKNRRVVKFKIPPLPNGGEITYIQGDSRRDDDEAFAPEGVKVERPA